MFFADDTTQANDATFIICLRLAHRLMAHGHEVVVLGNSGAAAPDGGDIDGVPQVRFAWPLNPATRAILNTWRQSRSVTGLLLSLLRHPFAAAVGALRALTGWNPIEWRYARLAAKPHKHANYGAMVAFSGSYYTARALVKTKAPGVRKIVYMTDPYATHYEMGGHRATKQEAAVLRRVDAAIVTPEMLAAYAGTPLAQYREKMAALEFPGVVPPSLDDNGIIYGKFPKDKINLLFAGNIYRTIRPAGAFLRLVAAGQNPRLHFTLMGRVRGELTAEEDALLAELVAAGRVTLVPPQPAAVARAAMAEADMLLNIGNTLPGMMPSKIYDCISTGKPIVNLCLIADDPTLPRLAPYPAKLNLIVKGGVSFEELAVRLDVFCGEVAGTQLPFGQIEALYPTATPAHACRVLLALAEVKSAIRINK